MGRGAVSFRVGFCGFAKLAGLRRPTKKEKTFFCLSQLAPARGARAVARANAFPNLAIGRRPRFKKDN